MRPKLCTESWLALSLGLVFGIIAVLFVPPAITFDGPSHYFRALQVSEGHFRADVYSVRAAGGTVPDSHRDFVQTLWETDWKKQDFGTVASWSALSARDQGLKSWSQVEFTNTAVYSPANYIFQALGMRLAAAISSGPLLASRLGCLFNLLGYLLLIVGALEFAPRFKSGILLLSLCPLILVQAASLSADAINFALPLLFVAWTWRLRDGTCGRPRAELSLLLITGLAIVLLKPTAIVTLSCLWLLPSSLFPSTKSKVAALCIYFLCALGVWYAWNRACLGIDIARWFEPDRSPASAQRAWFLGDPTRFVGPFLGYLKHGVIPQWPLMYGGVGGWIFEGALRPITVLSVVFLLAYLGCGSGGLVTDGVWAAGMAVLALVTLVLTALTLWLAFGTTAIDTIPFMVGRYLLPVVLGLGIAWSELLKSGIPRLCRGLFWLGLAANCAGLTAILGSIASRVS